MIQSVQYRKSAFLGSMDWLTLPWGDAGKDIYQQLYDKGFALAALLEGIDNANLMNDKPDKKILSEYLGRLSGLDDELSIWYHEILRESPSPLYWHRQSTPNEWHHSEAEEPATLSPFTFHTLRLGNIIVTYWALRLILSYTIGLASQHGLATHTQVPAHLLESHSGPHCLELSTNIVRSMPYCLSDDMGLMGAQKSLFPLRAALFALRFHPGDELKWCQALYQQLHGKKGIRYAREIAKIDGRFRAA